MSRWLLSVVAVVAFAATLWGDAGAGQPTGANAAAAVDGARQQVLEVFVRETCRSCADAKRYLPDFVAQRPGLVVVYRDVGEDPGALEELFRHAETAGRGAAVPLFHIDGRLLFGFIGPEQTGPALAALVDEASLDNADEVRSRLLGTLSVERLGLPAFTLAMGVLDGLNPCFVWALLFLLSMLVHLHDRMRVALIAGAYVLATAIFHYALMAAWLNLFLLAGLSIALQRVLGGAALLMGLLNIKDSIAPGSRITLSMPASGKPGLGARLRRILAAPSLPTALLTVVGFAVVVNLAELLCTAAFPAIYTAALSRQELPTLLSYGYLALYIVGYVLPPTAMVSAAVVALSSPRLSIAGGRWLKLLSGCVMVALAAVLIFRPEWVR
jgi:hypothetical protein